LFQPVRAGNETMHFFYVIKISGQMERFAATTAAQMAFEPGITK
jgi:hypothetical protein